MRKMRHCKIYKLQMMSNTRLYLGLVWFGLWGFMPLPTIFQLYHGGLFICGGNVSTGVTCRKSVTNICHIILFRVHLAMNGFQTHNVSCDKGVVVVVIVW